MKHSRTDAPSPAIRGRCRGGAGRLEVQLPYSYHSSRGAFNSPKQVNRRGAGSPAIGSVSLLPPGPAYLWRKGLESGEGERGRGGNRPRSNASSPLRRAALGTASDQVTPASLAGRVREGGAVGAGRRRAAHWRPRGTEGRQPEAGRKREGSGRRPRRLFPRRTRAGCAGAGAGRGRGCGRRIGGNSSSFATFSLRLFPPLFARSAFLPCGPLAPSPPSGIAARSHLRDGVRLHPAGNVAAAALF